MPEPSYQYQDRTTTLDQLQQAPISLVQSLMNMFQSIFQWQKAQADLQAGFAQQMIQQLGQSLPEHQQRNLFGNPQQGFGNPQQGSGYTATSGQQQNR